MKIDITITREDVERAVLNWFTAQPIAALTKGQDVFIGWSGGSTIIRANAEQQEEAT